MSVAYYFVGPDDSETCDGCDEAVNGNPYDAETVPEPGEFECGSRCRHMVQMQGDDIPDDMPLMQWDGDIGFTELTDDQWNELLTQNGGAEVGADGSAPVSQASGADDTQKPNPFENLDSFDDADLIAEYVQQYGITVEELVILGIITEAVAAQVNKILGSEATGVAYEDLDVLLGYEDSGSIASLMQGTPDLFDEGVQLGITGLDDPDQAYTLQDALNAAADNNGDAATYTVVTKDNRWYVLA